MYFASFSETMVYDGCKNAKMAEHLLGRTFSLYRDRILYWFFFKQVGISVPNLECGPMPNVMAALPNIVGALCSTPQSLADLHYQSAVQ